MNEQIGWQVELSIKSGQLESFRALTDEMIALAREETGVLVYERFISDDNRIVFVYERYTNSAAAVAHLQAFVQKFSSRFSTMVDRRNFVVFGTPSSDLRTLLDPFGATYFGPFAGFAICESA